MISFNSILLTLRTKTTVGFKGVAVFIKILEIISCNQNTCYTLVLLDVNVLFGGQGVSFNTFYQRV